jgi:hypothetical protein
VKTVADRFLMTVAEVDTDVGEVLLMTLANGEVPCEMRWAYGVDTTEILDAVGESYLVTIEKVTESVLT